jgi:hypothetical protein
MTKTWEDIITALQGRDAVIADDSCEFAWELEHTSIVQRIRRVEAHEREWLVISATVVDSTASSDEALAYNATLAIGALALEDGELVVRHALAMPVDSGELDEALEVIALEAAYVRLGGDRTTSAHEVFSYLAE